MSNLSTTLWRFSAALLLNILLLSPIHAAEGRDSLSVSSAELPRVMFKNLDVGVSVGTTGIGVDVSSYINRYVRVRTGVDFMPRFNVPLSFSLQSYTDGGVHSGNFETLQGYMKRLTGIDVDDRVEMDGKATMVNFKLLVDVYPWKDKGWRVTGGFFLGSRRVAKALNTMREMPSLLAVNIYNHFYDYFMETDFYETPIYGDYYLDPFLVEDVRAELSENGQMGIHIGDFKDGTPYMMQPDKEGMVSASAFVNVFRPYIGLGYEGSLTKDKRLNFDVDCGIMMWGGTPKLLTHDGVDLASEVKNIKGKPGDYVDFIKGIKVFPVLNFRVSYRLF